MAKTAFFVISTHLGGAERSLLDFFKGLNQDECKNIIVIFPKDNGPFIDELQHLGISFTTLPFPTWFLKISRNNILSFLFTVPLLLFYIPQQLLKVKQLIEKNDISTIHSTGLKFHILLMLYSFFDGRSKIIIHFRDIIKNLFLKSFFSFFKKSANLVFIANSRVTAQSVSELKPEVIYNGFDPNIYTAQPTNLKQQLGLDKTHKLVGIVAVIARWKGQREFLQAAAPIIQKNKDFHFLIIGDEIYDTKGDSGELAYLKSEVQNLQIEKNIHFLSFQKDLAPIYSALDLLTHCSVKPEPFGRVIVEAMLCGCPVAAAGEGGPLEIIEPYKNGLLHDMTDTKELENNILEILGKPSLAEQLASQALKDAQRFTLKSYRDKMKSLVF